MTPEQMTVHQLGQLGITPQMLGVVERLPLNLPAQHAALRQSRRRVVPPPPDTGDRADWLDLDIPLIERQASSPVLPAVDETSLVSYSFSAFPSSDALLLPAHSSVMDDLGLRLEVDPAGRDLRVISREGAAFQVRPDLRASAAAVADAAGIARVSLQQDGRFLIETATGTPLVVGWRESGALLLRPVFAWMAPPVEEWIMKTTDRWMQDRLARGTDADAWTRTSLAGQLARLCEPESRDVAALIASGRLQDLVSEVELAPRRWARTLPSSEAAALEQQAVRRAEALGDDLTDLFDTLSADMAEASESWMRLCHRRDDIESVRLLLKEAGVGERLDTVLDATDRTGRAIRINLEASLTSDDERLRRVALGDPSAWWGSTDFEAHYF